LHGQQDSGCASSPKTLDGCEWRNGLMAKKSNRAKKTRKSANRTGKPRDAKKRTPKAAAAKKSPKPSTKGNRARKKKTATQFVSKGGGNATAAGVTFQASVGAIFAAQLLAERPLDGVSTLRAKRPLTISPSKHQRTDGCSSKQRTRLHCQKASVANWERPRSRLLHNGQLPQAGQANVGGIGR